MAFSKKKHGPTFMVELPREGLGEFQEMLARTPRIQRQLEQATEPAITLECSIDEVQSLAVAFKIASIAMTGDAGKRMQAVHEQINELLEKYSRDREEASARPLVRTDEIFQFKISLQYIEPEIWRRVQMPDCTLYDLHHIIQIAMGWDDAHMHQFTIDGVRYSVPESDSFDMGLTDEDETRTLLSQIVTPKRRKVKIYYEYDFGDSWGHEVVFESRLVREATARYPRCLDGARRCPPEDSGGPWGYGRFLEALAHPDREGSAEDLEWIGKDWDPEGFSVKAVNKYLPRLQFIEDDDV